MSWLDAYYEGVEEPKSDFSVGSMRALNIMRQSEYVKQLYNQFKTVCAHPEVDYSFREERENICLIPGLSCSVPAYKSLLSEIMKWGTFNLIKLEGFPEDRRAIYSRLNITERAHLLLDIVEKFEWDKKIHLLWHSFGWLVAWYTRILHEDRQKKLWKESKIWTVTTLSAPLSWSVGLANLPGFVKWFRANQELDPKSDVIKILQEKGEVDHKFITEGDEIIRWEEMYFDRGQTHMLNHGHLDYILGPKHVIKDTAAQIYNVLLP